MSGTDDVRDAEMSGLSSPSPAAPLTNKAELQATTSSLLDFSVNVPLVVGYALLHCIGSSCIPQRVRPQLGAEYMPERERREL
jgi:hypothetical protein